MKQKGFSLAELSIVLIIIGLLVAGVSSGSKMINSAKIQRLMTEVRGIQTAFSTFYLTYDALPGDFKDAYDMFGSLHSCTDADANSSGSSVGCNGNGDGTCIFL